MLIENKCEIADLHYSSSQDPEHHAKLKLQQKLIELFVSPRGSRTFCTWCGRKELCGSLGS